jgi:hypothetical protein
MRYQAPARQQQLPRGRRLLPKEMPGVEPRIGGFVHLTMPENTVSANGIALI